MRDVLHYYEGHVEAGGIVRCCSPVVNVWHRDGSVAGDMANGRNFDLDLVIGLNNNPRDRKSKEDDPIVKDYLDVKVEGSPSLGFFPGRCLQTKSIRL